MIALVVCFVVFVVVLRVVGLCRAHLENMRTNLKDLVSSFDLSGLLLSLSGIVLGVLFAVSEYHVAWSTALVLILTVVPMHIYMQNSGRWWMAASVAGAVLTACLSYGTLLSLESLILLLFAYFIIRLAKGIGDGGRISDAVLTCLLKGPVALIGAYFVCTHSFPFWMFLLPSFSVGLLCVAADGTADGFGRHLTAFLISAGVLLMLAFSILRIFSPLHYMFLATVPVFLYIMVRIYMKKEQTPDIFRPALAVSVLVFALLAGLGFIGHLL